MGLLWNSLLFLLIIGVYFTSWIIDHPICFLPSYRILERKFMLRMVFVNVVSLFHLVGLAYFGVFNSSLPWTVGRTIRTLSLAIDVFYKCLLCWWYQQNSYCCVWRWLKEKYAQVQMTNTVQCLCVESVRNAVQCFQTTALFCFEMVVVCAVTLGQYFQSLYSWCRGVFVNTPQVLGVPETGIPDNQVLVVSNSASERYSVWLSDVDEKKPSVYVERRCKIHHDDFEGGELVFCQWNSSKRLLMYNSVHCKLLVYPPVNMNQFSSPIPDTQEHGGVVVF